MCFNKFYKMVSEFCRGKIIQFFLFNSLHQQAKRMDEDSNRSGPSAKRRKSNNEVDVQRQAELAALDVTQSSDIFKLTVDCFEEVFDYLSLNDLAAVGQTCKRMQKIASYFFKQNYGAVKGSFEMNDSIFVNTVEVNCFVDYIQKVSIDDDYMSDEEDAVDIDMNRIQHNRPQNFVNLLKHSKSLKEIEFGYLNLTETRINEMKEILNKMESVMVDDCEYDGHLLDTILASCPKLVHLCLDGSALIGSDRLQWLHRHYPQLKCIELLPATREEVPALKTFFELNTGIQKLAISDATFWFNRKLITPIDLKLNVLAIEHNRSCNLDSFCRLLKELYERGFYKNLHFYCSVSFQQEIINQLVSMSKLVKLRAKSESGHFHLSALVNLDELCINKSCLISDLKLLPITLVNLKMIHFCEASSDDILPFILSAAKVNKIKVLFLLSGQYFCELTKILNLSALNKEREKLTDARKITIYVMDQVYLATKWAMRQTDYSLIEMKRIDSYDWQHEFNSHYYRYDY